MASALAKLLEEQKRKREGVVDPILASLEASGGPALLQDAKRLKVDGSQWHGATDFSQGASSSGTQDMMKSLLSGNLSNLWNLAEVAASAASASQGVQPIVAAPVVASPQKPEPPQKKAWDNSWDQAWQNAWSSKPKTSWNDNDGNSDKWNNWHSSGSTAIEPKLEETKLLTADWQKRGGFVPGNHKTIFCKYHEQYGTCRAAGQCRFAHSREEQSAAMKARNQGGGYKTQPCKYFQKGHCAQGDLCTFLHEGVVPGNHQEEVLRAVEHEQARGMFELQQYQETMQEYEQMIQNIQHQMLLQAAVEEQQKEIERQQSLVSGDLLAQIAFGVDEASQAATPAVEDKAEEAPKPQEVTQQQETQNFLDIAFGASTPAEEAKPAEPAERRKRSGWDNAPPNAPPTRLEQIWDGPPPPTPTPAPSQGGQWDRSPTPAELDAQRKMNEANTGVKVVGFKHKQCIFFERGFCRNGDQCTYAHGHNDIVKGKITKEVSIPQAPAPQPAFLQGSFQQL
jgi:hypothetical protein